MQTDQSDGDIKMMTADQARAIPPVEDMHAVVMRLEGLINAAVRAGNRHLELPRDLLEADGIGNWATRGVLTPGALRLQGIVRAAGYRLNVRSESIAAGGSSVSIAW